MKIAIFKLFRFICNIFFTPYKYRIDYCFSFGSGWLTKNPLPWMNYMAIEHIKHNITDNFKVFEYGSGASTEYWISKGCEVTSVEHDKTFYNQLSKKIHSKCQYLLFEPESISYESKNTPESADLFHSSDYVGFSFERYVKYIDSFPDNFFDMVLVDGRARPSCIKRALPKIKKGGMLVVDNSNRNYYFAETGQLLENWPREVFTGTVRGLLHKEETTVFKNPYNEYAPIALFTYARPEHTKQTVQALLCNIEASETDLIVFSDAAKSTEVQLAVSEVRAYLATIRGFKSITLHHRPINYGLSRSIIDGVSEVLKVYDRVIVVEDDLVTSHYFLAFMNDALEKYKDDNRVANIHGYIYPVKESLPKTFFLRGADCWGWATWRRGWQLFNANGQHLLDELNRKNEIDAFDLNGAYSFSGMLKGQIKGVNDSWAVRWHASLFLANKLTLYPGRSLVHNIGFDASGYHCSKSSQYDVVVSKTKIHVYNIPVVHSNEAEKAFEKFFRGSLRLRMLIPRCIKSAISKCLNKLNLAIISHRI